MKLFGNYDEEIAKINAQILSIRMMDVSIAEQLKSICETQISLAKQQLELCSEIQRIEKKVK